MEASASTAGSLLRARRRVGRDGLSLTPELIEDFLSDILAKGRTPETTQVYRVKLYQLYDWLPEDKRVEWGTLESWRSSLLEEGYAARTVNLCISAANSLLEACGRRELQLVKPLALGTEPQPELTRAEYLRLLSTARMFGKEREYLMIKAFAAMGLGINDLRSLTVEAARAGEIENTGFPVHIPRCFQAELLDFAKREQITSGPLFTTKAGKPLARTSVTIMIQRLCHDARVPKEKATPRCLRKLYQSTRAGIQENVALLVEQAHDRLLESEQITVGWNAAGW